MHVNLALLRCRFASEEDLHHRFHWKCKLRRSVKQIRNMHLHLPYDLPSVILLSPTPWIGSNSTFPEIEYGPSNDNTGPLKFNSYLPSGFSCHPTTLEHSNFCMPCIETLENFSLIFTGLSAPWFSWISGICSGSIEMRLIPAYPESRIHIL